MGLTLSHRSALEVLRAVRAATGPDGLSLESTDLISPELESDQVWSSQVVATIKQKLGLPERLPLDILVPTANARIHNQNVTNHVWGTEVKGLCFLKLGNQDLAIPCPEILLAQMAEVVDLPELIALGHELCGHYTLRPSNSPLSAVMEIPPITSEEQIRNLLKLSKGLRGRSALKAAMPRIRDGSLSPQETCLSTMVQLPTNQSGYGIGKVDLNQTLKPGPWTSNVIKASSRMPDLLIRHTKVGINYDGDGHVDLTDLVSAAKDLALEPRSVELAQALTLALDKARKDITADKQRDRDLVCMGYSILPLTKHDLETIDNLDFAMRQVIHLIEHTTQRDMRQQKHALDDKELKRDRGKLLETLRLL